MSVACRICKTRWAHLKKNSDGIRVCELCQASGMYDLWLENLEDEKLKAYFKDFKSPYRPDVEDNIQFDHEVFMDFVNKHDVGRILA